jgi:hypothetical protein
VVKATAIEKELAEIKSELLLIHRQVDRIKERLEGSPPIEEVLHRRGLVLGKSNPTESLLLPADVLPAKEKQFYEMMKRYSFRIFLREVISRRACLQPPSLRRFCSPETEEEYTQFLVGCGVLRRGRQGLALAKDTVRNFGGTLEWFVAQVMEREFACPAIWGAKFGHLKAGGDYDVLSWVERNLLYLEVKSSPPKHIEGTEIGSFMDRVNALMPNFAVLLVDTELRMKDKVVPLFEEQLAGPQRRERTWILRLFDETFLVQDRIFVTNSRPNLISNLARILGWCLGQKATLSAKVGDDQKTGSGRLLL